MASHVEEELGSQVSMILDGGACQIGLESTVLGFENDDPVLMRPGGIPIEEWELVVGRLRVKTNPAVLQSPGQLASHLDSTASGKSCLLPLVALIVQMVPTSEVAKMRPAMRDDAVYQCEISPIYQRADLAAAAAGGGVQGEDLHGDRPGGSL